jgi:hypothetical protein
MGAAEGRIRGIRDYVGFTATKYRHEQAGHPALSLYPRSTGDFQVWFGTDADCLDYLEWPRWPDGIACPGCGQGGWRLGDGILAQSLQRALDIGSYQTAWAVPGNCSLTAPARTGYSADEVPKISVEVSPW